MNLTFIEKCGSRQLLLIYAGWSTNADAFSGISCRGYDIAVAWNYSELTPPAISGYDEVVLLAWSLGVHVAELTATALPLTLTIAVNGTPTPKSDTEGIPERIYQATADALSEQSLAKFRRRMGAASMPRGSRTIESLKAELINFPMKPVSFRWDRAVISSADMIFPAANQERAWRNRALITRIEGPHLPDFQRIINMFIINKSLVCNRFSRGLRSYDSEADVQRRIADHLFALWQKHGLQSGPILEIGAGSGYFTSLYRPHLTGCDITLWDIAPANDNIVCADAEQQLPRLADGSIRAIVSASTMQWFNSQAAFLRQCARVLAPGGLAVLSSFGPETFRQLSEAGVIGLPYLDEDSYRQIMPPELEILELQSGKIQKVFDEPVNVLRHLQATGVNARPSTKSVRRILELYPRRPDGRCGLTYQPIYLILRRK